MKSYTELSNVNSVQDVDCIDYDETSWKLINAKILYKSGMMYSSHSLDFVSITRNLCREFMILKYYCTYIIFTLGDVAMMACI